MSGGGRRLTAAQFALLWERAGFDRMPYPFNYRRAGGPAGPPELPEDAQLGAMVDTLAHAEVRVEVRGLHGAAKPMVVRVLGGFRGEQAVVSAQLPGVDEDDGSDVLLAPCHRDHLVRRVVEMLPPARPGRGSGVSVPRYRLEQELDPSDGFLESVGGGTSAGDAVRRFFSRPRRGVGEVMVATGFGLGEVQEGFCWVDVEGDGRYVIRNDEMVAANPAGPEDVDRVVARLVDRALDRERERVW